MKNKKYKSLNHYLFFIFALGLCFFAACGGSSGSNEDAIVEGNLSQVVTPNVSRLARDPNLAVEPVSNATVSVGNNEAVTDANGNFRLSYDTTDPNIVSQSNSSVTFTVRDFVPLVTTLPEGTIPTGSAVINADRRDVVRVDLTILSDGTTLDVDVLSVTSPGATTTDADTSAETSTEDSDTSTEDNTDTMNGGTGDADTGGDTDANQTDGTDMSTDSTDVSNVSPECGGCLDICIATAEAAIDNESCAGLCQAGDFASFGFPAGTCAEVAF